MKRLTLANILVFILMTSQTGNTIIIDYIFEKLVKFTGIFYRLRSKISSEWLKNIYYYFVYPNLLYGIEIYANTCMTYLDKMIKLNNTIT